jgi:hypothetical protein
MEDKDERKEIAEDLGAATTGSYLSERRRQRSARKKAKKPSGLADAELSADERDKAMAREAERRRRSGQDAPVDS